MKNKSNLLFSLLLLVLVGTIYREWFFSKEIIGGDWPYVFPDVLRDLSFPPPSWASWVGNGLGGINPVYFLHLYQNFTASIAYYLGIPWPIIYKIFWFGAFILISTFSSIYLIKKMVSDLSFDKALIAGFIFTSNTYILMVVGGGQMGVAMAYSLTPLVLAVFIKLIGFINFNNEFKGQNSKFKITIQSLKLLKRSIISGVVLGIHIMFDPRITFITMIAVALFCLINIRNFRKIKSLILFAFVIPGVIAVLLHASWIIPLLLSRHNPIVDLGSAIPTVAGLRFFSFAGFSQSLSFLHPNWPENIFGKTYFMKAEFLVLPILAYSSLLFLSSKFKVQSSKLQLKIKSFENNLAVEQFNNRTIMFFALLGLIGAFLAKGANPPFGELNIWLFENIPGFGMFRDPTKFYVLIALSYSVLIPFSVYSIYSWLRSKVKSQKSKVQFKIQNYLPNLFLIFTILYLIFLIRPAVLGRLTGTFKRSEVPKEYVMLEDLLRQQPDFFRALWVPRQQRFTFSSNIHPSVEAAPLFNATNSAKLIEAFRQKNTQDYLSKLGIKYVVIPYDSLGEIFLEDRKYNSKKRREIEEELDKIYWLTKIQNGKIAVYENQSFKDHFWLENNDKFTYKMISPVKYSLHVNINKPTNLIFSENYNSYWQAKIGDEKINSNKSSDNLNMFKLTKIGSYNVEVYFKQDIFYKYGIVISLVFLTITLFMLKLKNYEK